MGRMAASALPVRVIAGISVRAIAAFPMSRPRANFAASHNDVTTPFKPLIETAIN
jgi:hypothetical protein